MTNEEKIKILEDEIKNLKEKVENLEKKLEVTSKIANTGWYGGPTFGNSKNNLDEWYLK